MPGGLHKQDYCPAMLADVAITKSASKELAQNIRELNDWIMYYTVIAYYTEVII
jgi:hypothetical protein